MLVLGTVLLLYTLIVYQRAYLCIAAGGGSIACRGDCTWYSIERIATIDGTHCVCQLVAIIYNNNEL